MKSPAFQFYPKDWLSSRRVRMMTAEQRGWYIQLLAEAWDSEIQGSLPNDPKLLWILAGASSEQVFNTCSECVLSMFEIKGNHLFHHRLADELAKQHHMSELRAKAGRESGKSRRQALKDKHLARMNTCSLSVEQNMNSPSEQNTNTPSTIASASANAYKRSKTSFKKPTEEEATVYSKEISLPSSEVQGFLNHHDARGWILNNGKLMVDWKAALRTWKGNAEKFGRIPKESEKKDYSIGTGCFAPDYGKEEAK